MNDIDKNASVPGVHYIYKYSDHGRIVMVNASEFLSGTPVIIRRDQCTSEETLPCPLLAPASDQ